MRPGAKSVRDSSHGLDLSGFKNVVQDIILRPKSEELGRKYQDYSSEGHVEQQLERMARIE